MTDASLALQGAIIDRLRTSAVVTALVPADGIVDRHKAPEIFPILVIGEGQTVDPGERLDRRVVEAFLDLHAFAREESLKTVKDIAGAVRVALREPFFTADGWDVVDVYPEMMRFLRDPDGTTAHAVISVRAVLRELLP